MILLVLLVAMAAIFATAVWRPDLDRWLMPALFIAWVAVALGVIASDDDAMHGTVTNVPAVLHFPVCNFIAELSSHRNGCTLRIELFPLYEIPLFGPLVCAAL